MEEGLLYVPPMYFKPETLPIIFLGGPIQGTRDWQSNAITYIHGKAKHLNIASPRRLTFDESVDYDTQVDWELYHLSKAGDKGVVLFWMAKEDFHECTRAFAQTSRWEVSEFKMRHQFKGTKIAVGIEEGFSGGRYMRKRFKQECPDIKIYNTLEDTCDEAIRLASA
ncbi:MAG TPA: nucleoside 2-deoxyribosyltransferase domain-containing protein [Candidatus Nanoarchaeia archaeon]|nr:nucleoside 2-deoxyribosyltransferase domain-containing protein [Candidatus Nanoarchaeia archaeon]